MAEHSIHDAFDTVKASDALKTKTREAVLAHTPQPVRRTYAVRWAVACCAVLVLAVLSGGFLFFDETAYISVDVNPSVELGLNRFGMVVSQTAYNDDGSALLSAVDVRYKSADDAVTLLLGSEAFAPYATESSLVSVTVLGSEETEEELLDTFAANEACQQVQAQCAAEQSDLRAEAHENGLSFGKYRAYLTLRQYDPSVTPEQCQAMTMREIQDRIDAFAQSGNASGDGASAVTTTTVAGNGSGHQYGQGAEGSGSGDGNGEGNQYGKADTADTAFAGDGNGNQYGQTGGNQNGKQNKDSAY